MNNWCVGIVVGGLAPFACMAQPTEQRTYRAVGAVAIPDIVEGLAAFRVGVGGHAPLLDSDVGVLIRHTWQGDLTIRLEHVQTGSAVRMVDRAGSGPCGSIFGFSADDFGDADTGVEFVLDDDSGTLVYDAPPIACPGLARVSGRWRPEAPLAALDGENRYGDWRLVIDDHGAGDVGVALAFSLVLTTPHRCPGDWDGNARVEPADVAGFVGDWFSGIGLESLAPDVDGSGALAPADIAVFVGVWLSDLASGC